MPEAPTNQEKKRNYQMILIIVGIIIAAAILFGGGAFLFTQLFSGHIKTPDEYQTMTLEPSSYTSTVGCAGEIRAGKSSSVSPEVSGTISRVLVDEGEKIKKGQVLFTIKNDSITKTYKKNRDAYVKASASEQKVYSSYKAAAKSLDETKNRKNDALKAAEKKQKELEEKQSTASNSNDSSSQDSAEDAEASQVTVDPSYDEAINNAQSSLDSIKSSYEAAKSTASDAKNAYESALEQQRLLTVRAGEGGTVIKLKAEKGMSTGALPKGVALQIVDLNTLVGVVEVPEASVASVARGQEAEITSDSLPGKKISATVSKIANTPTEASDSKGSEQGTTYDVTLTIGSAPKAKVGMKINASIELQEFGSVYYVPASAIRQQGNASYVEIVYNDNTTEQHQVTVVGTSDDGKQVIKGDTLAQGTTIRTDLSN